MFKLKTPCANCPFRKDVTPFITAERVAEIVQATSFQCHKTVDYDQFDDPEGRAGEHPQQCAGLMLTLHRSGHANQIMQVAERMGSFDPGALSGPAYNDLWEALEAHGGDPDVLLPRWMRKRAKAS